MNSESSLMPIRELVRSTWADYKRQFPIFFKALCWPLLAVVILYLVSPMPGRGGLGLGQFVGGLITFYLTIVLYVVLLKPADDLKTVYKRAWQKVWPFIVISLLVALSVILGFIALIIPGIYLLPALSFAIFFYFLEDIRGMAAIKASYRLVKGRWWGVTKRLLVFMVIAFLLAFVSAALTGDSRGRSSTVISPIVSLLFIAPAFIIYWHKVFLGLKKSEEPAV